MEDDCIECYEACESRWYPVATMEADYEECKSDCWHGVCYEG
jgi:hypothetical protein